MKNRQLTPEQRELLLTTLESRFGKNMSRHKTLKWDKIKAKLQAHPEKLWSLYQMEETEGEPDVVDYHQKTDEYIFFDCSPEVQNDAVSATTTRPGMPAKPTNRKAMSLIPQPKWELNCSQKNNTASFRNWVNLIRKRQAGCRRHPK